MKKRKTTRPTKNPTLSEHEQERADNGCSIVPARLGKLLVALQQDFREVLFAVGSDVVRPENLGIFGDRIKDFSAIRRRLSLGLEYTISDIDSVAENGGHPISYQDGIGCVLSIARMLLPRHLTNDSKRHEFADDVEHLRYQIDGCIIALVVRGELQHAADLMRLAGCVMAIDRDEIGAKADELKPGFSKRHSDNFHKLRVLLALDDFLRHGEIPTKSKLRNKVLGLMHASNFSKMLKEMHIRDLLPNESKVSKPEDRCQGTSFPTTISPKKKLVFCASAGSTPSIVQAAEACDGTDRDPHSLRLTRNSAMIDKNIHVIRERLGSMYHLLLIEFGLSELEDEADLLTFETRLLERGMRLS